jgi:hypothetical protein
LKDNMSTINIRFINNIGNGFSGIKQVPAGQTLGQFCANVDGTSYNATNYTILVNKQVASADYVLRENDRVSITPIKVAGARSDHRRTASRQPGHSDVLAVLLAIKRMAESAVGTLSTPTVSKGSDRAVRAWQTRRANEAAKFQRASTRARLAWQTRRARVATAAVA